MILFGPRPVGWGLSCPCFDAVFRSVKNNWQGGLRGWLCGTAGQAGAGGRGGGGCRGSGPESIHAGRCRHDPAVVILDEVSGQLDDNLPLGRAKSSATVIGFVCCSCLCRGSSCLHSGTISTKKNMSPRSQGQLRIPLACQMLKFKPPGYLARPFSGWSSRSGSEVSIPGP